ncbi:MAG: DUF2934 domain-containing protein [Lacunisphaera sp.]
MPSDLTPQITTRAYELYEKGGRKSDSAVQDWEQAKREIQKSEAKAEPESEAKAEPKPEAKAEAKAEPKPDAKAEAPSNVTPQLVKRVHELYEELGREEVKPVEDWEKSKREIRPDAPKAEPQPETKK